MTVCCLLLRTNTCLWYGTETSLKFHYISFLEKRSSGRPFYTIHYTSISQLCLNKLDNMCWSSGRENLSWCFPIRLNIFKTSMQTKIFTTVVTANFLFWCLKSTQKLAVWHCSVLVKWCLEPANHLPFLLRNCFPGFHQDWCLSSSRHCRALSSARNRWNQHHCLGQGPYCPSVGWGSQRLNHYCGQFLEKPWSFGWMKEKC